MKKKIFSSILMVMCVLLCLVLLPGRAEAATVDSGTCGENLTWTLDDQGTLTISGTGVMEDWDYSSVAQWYYYQASIKKVVIEDGVTTIGDFAFIDCFALTSVVIPDTVKSIGGSAFSSCTGLASVKIPDSVTFIGDQAFMYCAKLTGIWVDSKNPNYSNDSRGVFFNKTKTILIQAPRTITGAYSIPDTVTSISNFAFFYCTELTSVTIPDSAITIGYQAFYNCDGLISLNIPDGVTTIGESAFSGCTNLISVTIPNSVTTIGSFAFDFTAWYDNQPDGLIYAGKVAYKYKGDCPSRVTIKDGTLSVAGYAFYYCEGLTSVTIPNSVVAIGDCAFYSCVSLTSVTIPDSIVTIGDCAFYYCIGLTSLSVPDSVVIIGYSAFGDCIGLTSVTIPDSVVTIGYSAFEGCVGLTSVTIPDSVVTIGGSVFKDCTSLTSVTIPNSVTTIDYGAFRNCTSLTSVTIPNSVTTIDYGAFRNCTSLTSVIYCGTDNQWNNIYIDSYNSPLTSATRYYHNFENGSCTICGEVDPEAIVLFDIDVARMILGNSLEFQFGVDKSKFDDMTGIYAVVEKGDVTKTIPATQWGTVGPYYAIVYDGLAAKEMADEISVTIYDADGQAISNTKTDSVRDYVMRNVNQQSAALKTLMVDMLNYGAAAQGIFQYNTADLANNQLTDTQKSWATQTLAATSDSRVEGTNYYGTRLVLEGRIQMQVAFKGMNRTMYAVYSYTDHYGKEQSVTVTGEDFIEVGGLLGVELSQLVYADARQLVTIRIFNAKGVLLSTVQDSMESYIHRNGGTEPLYDALMKFTDSAKAYLH